MSADSTSSDPLMFLAFGRVKIFFQRNPTVLFRLSGGFGPGRSAATRQRNLTLLPDKQIHNDLNRLVRELWSLLVIAETGPLESQRETFAKTFSGLVLF